ncbi:MAG TPA: GNAT family N-acetyltransferase [Patescibacteria group bacterium]|nr:GNAT family N-acetyltransferase [Patescibacteria group bacterium]
MARFISTLSESDIAMQIAILLNKHNRLIRQHNLNTIMASTTDYYVELAGQVVVGCVGLVRQDPALSLIKHLSVHEEHRRRGLAERLLRTAISCCGTQYSYMTVREDNNACLALANKLQFMAVTKNWSKDHNVVVLGRKNT